MTDISQAFIDAIKTLANHDKIKAVCEPNVCWHEDVKDNQVLRVLTAFNLIKEQVSQIN